MTGHFSWTTSENNGSEIADQCAWSFGKTYQDGYKFNVSIGTNLFLVQQIWQRGRGCVLGGVDFITTSKPFNLNEGSTPDPGHIHYYGGRVMHRPIEVVLLWYGSWHNLSRTQNIINNVIDNLGESDWWGVVSDYYEEAQ